MGGGGKGSDWLVGGIEVAWLRVAIHEAFFDFLGASGMLSRPSMSERIIEQFQRFLNWTGKKAGIHFSDRTVYFDEREIWWASLGENVGMEANGKNYLFERPVIVLRKFSKDMLLAVPCTTKLRNGTWYFRYSLEGKEYCAVMQQVRAISGRRLIRKAGQLSPQDFSALQNAVTSLIKTEPPAQARGSSDPLSRTR